MRCVMRPEGPPRIDDKERAAVRALVEAQTAYDEARQCVAAAGVDDERRGRAEADLAMAIERMREAAKAINRARGLDRE